MCTLRFACIAVYVGFIVNIPTIEQVYTVLSPTYFPFILFDGENISFDASLVLYI